MSHVAPGSSSVAEHGVEIPVDTANTAGPLVILSVKTTSVPPLTCETIEPDPDVKSPEHANAIS